MTKKYCGFFKHSDGSREGYLSKTPAIEEIAAHTKKYTVQLLTDACDELAAKGYIAYQVKDLYVPRRSTIRLIDSGKQAYEYAEYLKIAYKKWGKRSAAALGTIIALFTIWYYVFPKNENSKSTSPPLSIKADTTTRKH